jgi:hypothetical protein
LWRKLMSIMTCEKHWNRPYDTDFVEQCPLCLDEETTRPSPEARGVREALVADADIVREAVANAYSRDEFRKIADAFKRILDTALTAPAKADDLAETDRILNDPTWPHRSPEPAPVRSAESWHAEIYDRFYDGDGGGYTLTKPVLIKLVERIQQDALNSNAAPSVVGVPDGYVLVPREPTDAMLKAAHDLNHNDIAWRCPEGCTREDEEDGYIDASGNYCGHFLKAYHYEDGPDKIYEAMISAAPSPTVPSAPGDVVVSHE